MLKGMSMPFTRVAGLVLGILFLVVGYQVVNSLHANSLEKGSQSLKGAMGSFGTQTVQVGKGESSELDAERQLRQLTVFNMLSAANCNALSTVSVQVSEDKQFSKKTRDKYGEPPVLVRFFQSFKQLRKQTEFSGLCAGSSPVDLNPVDDALNVVNPLRGGGPQSENDMEGRFGRVFFKINKQFIINDGDYDQDVLVEKGYDYPDNSGHGEKLLAMDLYPIIRSPKYPDFWKGQRIAAFLPAGISYKVDDPKFHELYNDEGFKNEDFYESYGAQGIFEGSGARQYRTGKLDSGHEKLYYYRVRMKSVPKVLPADKNPEEWRIKEGGTGNKDKEGRFERFVENARYVFCKNAEGFIQSNAKDIGNGDDVGGDKVRPLVENAVFPKIEITGSGGSCINGGGERASGEFLGNDLPKNPDPVGKCNLEKALSSGDKSSGSSNEMKINGEQVKLSCGLESKTTSVKHSGKSHELDYYKPGWFAEKCLDSFSVLDQYQVVRNPDTGIIEEKSDGLVLESKEYGDAIEVSYDQTDLDTTESLTVKVGPASEKAILGFFIKEKQYSAKVRNDGVYVRGKKIAKEGDFKVNIDFKQNKIAFGGEPFKMQSSPGTVNIFLNRLTTNSKAKVKIKSAKIKRRCS